jgi:hypothetical protein
MSDPLTLQLVDHEAGPSIKALHDPLDDYSYWKPELEAAIAAEIRKYPNMDAEWWLAPSAVLNVVEQHLLQQR